MKKPVEIFISYSHKDAAIASGLEKHLSILERRGEVKGWHDRSIGTGVNWRDAIDEHLASADIILILVSADFLASDYCYDVEMRRALELHDSGKAVVIPIIVRPCDWTFAPFAKLQALPRDGKPITEFSNRDAAFTQVAENIRKIIERLEEPTPTPISADSTGEVELIIAREFESYTDKDKERLLEAVRKLLQEGSDVKIVRKDRGSVKLRLRLSADEVNCLHAAVQNGELQDLDVVDAEIHVDPEHCRDLPGRPSVFIGSSKEGLPIAEAIQVNLDELCEVTLWSQGIFGVSELTLEALVKNLKRFDFAILVLTPDDLLESRGEVRESPRDNVLLELGLFIGHLGRQRTFTVFDRTADLKLPSDMAGVTPATYQPHSSGNLEAALGAPCTRLKKIIAEFGIRSRGDRT